MCIRGRGNSEVGHTNIGAGRVVYQMLVKITKDIEDGVFFENKALLAAMENCKQHDSALHLMGLVSPGGVHSHTDHLYGLLEMAKRHGLSKVYVHCFLDGRDVPPDSGWEYVPAVSYTPLWPMVMFFSISPPPAKWRRARPPCGRGPRRGPCRAL